MQNRNKLRLLRLCAGFCACLCLFSATMTGTYAWQSQQHATNDLWGTADTLIPVELTKLEMEFDGRITENPVAGAVFYIYKKDGTQIGGQYMTDENGKINVELLPGAYYFEETVPPYGYTYPLNEQGEPVSRHEFVVEEQQEPYETVELTVYNRRLQGDLIISKAIQNHDGAPLSDAQREETFTFVVTFTEENAFTGMPDFSASTDLTAADGGEVYTYRINNGLPQTIVSGGTLQLRSGEIAVFEGLKEGLLYHVAEKPAEGYTTTAIGHQGNIRGDAPALASFINTYGDDDTGTLIVSKKVENGDGTPLTEAQKGAEFKFRLTVGESVHVFTLKSGESKSFRGIAPGTDYLVQELTEELPEGYIAVTDTYSGTVTGERAVELPFTNVYAPETPTEPGQLVVRKEVKGEGDDTKYFTIAVSFEGEEGVATPETKILQLKAGQSEIISDIPHGVIYTVMEADAAGYLPAWEVTQGSIIGGRTTEAAVVNMVPEDPDKPDKPTPETVTITIRKELAVGTASGGFLPEDYARLFNMTLYVNGAAAEHFSLMPADPSDTSDVPDPEKPRVFVATVPYGASYEVREENYFSSGFSQSILNGSGIATEDIEVVVTNTYIGTPRVEIEGEKTWVIPEGVNVTLPESITIQLMDGTTVAAQQEVKGDAAGRWRYSFVAPQYRADGVTEIEYTIGEVSVPHFHMGRDPENPKTNIVNTYVEPLVESDPPITIRKNVVGSNAPDAVFTFAFESRTANAPMPEGAVGQKKEFRLRSGEVVEVGKLTFTEVGTYEYVVYEVNEGEKDWSYDAARYTIVYEITEDPNTRQLSIVRTVEKNSTETVGAELVFTNTYEREDNSKVVISGQKTWVHRGNPAWNRPSAIIVEVYGDGERVYQKQVTEKDGWRYSFSFDKYADDGHEILYTVDEQTVRDYTKKIDGYNITNTYSGTTPSGPTPGTPSTPDTPNIPDTPNTPDKPEKDPDGAQTGDDSRIPFWLMMTFASMLATFVAIRALHTDTYVGKRVSGKRSASKKKRM